ncbi:hypothetical protein M472_09255 [Sphingobacterium paucimobilis HER1398]|uniref:Peptidase C51 domain-containing protein n=2 Tax=Sphingobacterium TaxID=28453 RepID=U2J8G3_9SPHI|nr:hypothetical protein M472_09255 [Sphingobacterium paucimobilis HER1398]
MYYLFFSILFTAICSDNGDGSGVLSASMPAHGIFILLDQNEAKNQGLAAKLPAQAAGGSYFFSAKKYAKNSSLKTFDTEEVHPRAIVKNFLGDKGSECKGLAYYTTSLQLGLISPLKQFPIKDDLLTYGVKGRKAIIYKNLHFAAHKDLPSVSSQARFQSKGRKKGVGTLETALIALRSRDEHRLNSLDLCGTFYQGKVPRWSADEDNKRIGILNIATAELGVKESTGNNDGLRVDNSLRLAQPRPFFKASAIRSICTISENVAFDIFKNLKEEARSIVLKISSDEFLRTFCGKKYEPRHGSSGIKAKHSADEDKRNLIITIASAELGVKESTGNNDGLRIEQYLAYTGLTKGYEWCAAFVSWCYGRAGLAAPRNPWSPALFPKARTYWKEGKSLKGRKGGIEAADIFGIYGTKAQRIVHVGLVKEQQRQYLISIEGNSNNRVESRRRHLRTVHAVSDWIDEKSSTL